MQSFDTMQNVTGGKIIILGGHNKDYSKQKIVYICVLFRTVSKRVVSLYSSKIVDNKEILPTVSNKSKTKQTLWS
jgi:acyl CoA:acetate/3-ketoacid CoA transferase beta subunit